MRLAPLAALLNALVLSGFVASAGCSDDPSDDGPGSGGTPAGVGGAQGGGGGSASAGAAGAGATAGAGVVGGNAGAVTSGGSAGAPATGGGAGFAAGGAGAGGVAGSGAGGASQGGSSGSNTVGGTAGSPGGASGEGGAGGTAGEGAGASGAAGSGAGAGAGGASGAGGGAGTAGTGGQQMNLPTGVTAMFPGPNATGVCRDTQLRVTFPGPPTLGSSGNIRVNDSGGTAVATVNMGAMTITDTINGQMYSLPRRAFVDGNEAVIYLPRNALSYGQTYSVTIENGAINRPNNGGAFTIADNTTWRFTLASAAPSNLGALAVDLRGGQFCSVLGALEALPANNDAASTLTIAAGTYHEVINMSGKNKVTLRGASRTGTVISGVNNNNMNPSTRGRALLGFDNLSDLVIENLTIHNLTPQGGSQAEALRLGSCNHCIIRDADIKSLQDTLLWGGTVYAKNCLIAGNVDYIWGSGAAYFDRCEIRTVGRAGYIVQSRNANPGYGYVFVDSRLTSDPPNLTGDVLARIDVSAYPGSHVAYIDCEMGSHVSASGWTITGGAAGSGLRFWEYQSKAPGGALINTSGRNAGSTQLTAQQAAMMRDKATVLGGWNPN